MLRTK